MSDISRASFEYHNHGKQLNEVFEDMCLDFFRINNGFDDEFIVIQPNNPGIETEPVHSKGFQAKYNQSTIDSLESQLNKSFLKSKLKIYPNLKEIVVYTNRNIKTSAKRWKKSRYGKKIKYINGKSLLNELKKEKYFIIQNKYFGQKDIIGFFTDQLPKKKEYIKVGFKDKWTQVFKNGSEINHKKLYKTITEDDNKHILISGKLASGKSYYITHLLNQFAVQILKGKNTRFPICLRASHFSKGDLLSSINSRLSTFGLGNLYNQKNVIIFIDGVNELSLENRELFFSHLERLETLKNVKKIVITSRNYVLGSNYFDEDDLQKIEFKSNQEYDINDRIERGLEGFHKLPLLHNKKEKVKLIIGEIANSFNWHENAKIQLDNVVGIIDSYNFTASEMDQIISFILNSGFFHKLTENEIIFNDQKYYEYFYAFHLSKFFYEHLDTIRNSLGVSDSNIFKLLQDNLEQSNLSLSEITIKNLFTKYYHNQSRSDSSWGFDGESFLFELALSSQKYLIEIVNENETIEKMFNKKVFNMEYIYTLQHREDGTLFRKYLDTYVEQKNKNLKKRNKIISSGKEYAPKELEKISRELGMDDFLEGYEYFLLRKFEEGKLDLEKQIGGKDHNYAVAKFIILMLRNLEYDYVNRVILNITDKNLKQDVVIELVKFENIGFLKHIDKESFKHLCNYSLEDLLTLLDKTSKHSDNFDITISFLIIYFFSKDNIKEKTKEIIIDIIHRKSFNKVVLDWHRDNETALKFLILRSFLFETKEISSYGGPDGIVDVLELTDSFVNNYLSLEGGIDDLYILIHNYLYLLDFNIYHSFPFEIKSSLLKYMIGNHTIERGYKLSSKELFRNFNFNYITLKKIIAYLLKEKQIEFHSNDLLKLDELYSKSKIGDDPNEKYDYYLMRSIIFSNLGKYTESYTSLNKAINSSYVRIGRRKDYILDVILDVVFESFNNGSISEEILYEVIISIYSDYMTIYPHADGKGLRHLPITLLEYLGKTDKSLFIKFTQELSPNKGGYYHYVGYVNGLNFLLEKPLDIDEAFNLIKKKEKFPLDRDDKGIVQFADIMIHIELLCNGYYSNVFNQRPDVLEYIISTLQSSMTYISSQEDLQKIVDEDHYGLEKKSIKDKIVEAYEIGYLRFLPFNLNIKKFLEVKPKRSTREYKKFKSKCKKGTIQKYLDHDNDYELLVDDIPAFIVRCKYFYPNDYISKIVNSKLFYFKSSGFYYRSGKEDGVALGMELEKSDSIKFKEAVMRELIIDKDMKTYYDNFDLTYRILTSKNDINEISNLIILLKKFSHLICS